MSEAMNLLTDLPDTIYRWLPDQSAVAERVVRVMAAVPDEVRTELFGDPGFSLAMEDFVPGRGTQVWMGRITSGGRGNRCIVLRQRLATCAVDFAYYVIAHEIAHAILWNGGWNEITDPEDAADALAASWGFPRPAYW